MIKTSLVVFFRGLKEEICLPVKMFNPPTLMMAYGLAKMQEEHMLSTRIIRSSNLNFPSSSSPKFGGRSSIQKPSIRGQKPFMPIQKNFQS